MRQNKSKFNKSELFEEYEDSLWRVIMYNYAEHEGKEILKEHEADKDNPEYQPSKEERKLFHKKLNNELRKHKLRSIVKTTKKVLPKFAVIFLILAIGFTTLFMTVEAFRGVVLNFIVTFYDTHVEVRLPSNNPSNIPISFSNGYIPTYIPKGYLINGISDMGEYKMIEYINDEGKFIDFYEFDSSMKTAIDTENADIIKSIKINGIDGIFVLKNEKANISWANAERVFLISAQLSEKEMVKIAESVIFVEPKPFENIYADFDLSNGYAPMYIPAGYWIDDIRIGGTVQMILYENDNGNKIDFMALTESVNIDNEEAEIFKNIEINGITGIYILKNNDIKISWANDDRIFILLVRPQLPEAEIIKIAESVVFVE
jgi:hypothetical protein